MNEFYEKFRDRTFFDNHPEAIANHLDKFYQSSEITVFHEMLMPDFHLDVYFINSSEDDFNILLTSGMSLLEMTVREGLENPELHKFAELMILLPKEIEFGKIFPSGNENDWIIGMLKETARFPHHYDTWLTIGHTLQATADMEPYSEKTDYVGLVILPSVTFDEEFTEIKINDEVINIYTIFPLYKNELEYKISNGYNALLDKLIEKDGKEVFDKQRENLLV
ncbi:suppressor of fused domain protein [Pedobacter agri]|uniref:suppressor of fused domain protein n=1 Tax=Pedobacter agri TaxID=454586 RepID=UPI00292DCEC1|nr:suppressor of fused domain protein [Pedobacter agri]